MSSQKKHRTDTHWTAQSHTVDGDLKIPSFAWMSSYKQKQTWPRGYKTFFMHNSTEHEISTAHKLKYPQIKKFLALSLSGVVFIMLINVVGIFNIYEQDKFQAQLS